LNVKELFRPMFAMLVVCLFLFPTRAVASTDARENRGSGFALAISQLVELVADLLFSSGEEVDGRCSVDPVGCSETEGDHIDLTSGIDPWG
jgi:hypothetical protein